MVKHSWGWSPSYKEEISTDYSKEVFFELADQVASNLKWKRLLSDLDEMSYIAKAKWGNPYNVDIKCLGEKKMEVKSSSASSEFWDIGNNYRRVQEFKVELEKVLLNTSESKVAEIQDKIDNPFKDYIVPDYLPPPPDFSNANRFYPIFAGLASSIIIGILLGVIACAAVVWKIKYSYIIGLFDVLVGLGIWFGINMAMKITLSEVSFLMRIWRWIFVSIVHITRYISLYFLLTYYFGYSQSLKDLIDFFIIVFNKGANVKGLDLGTIGFVVVIAFEIYLASLIFSLKLNSSSFHLIFLRVPPKTREYISYLLSQGTEKEEILSAMVKHGWYTEQHKNILVTEAM